MSKEKQIEEKRFLSMAEDILEDFASSYSRVDKEQLAKYIRKNFDEYTTGYRKQEWISVEDRLPELLGSYLVFTHDRRMFICPFIDHYCDGDAQFDDYKVTHWMPLPEPPKGGAE